MFSGGCRFKEISMKKLLCVFLIALPATLFAAGPFDGTWVAKLDTAQFSPKPDVYLLDKGMYSCPSCIPKIEIKADGQDQKVTGSAYMDTMSVKVVDANTVEFVTKKGGKTIGKETDTVSGDGKTLSQKFTDYSAANGKVVTGEGIEARVSKGAAGAHAISGSWRTQKVSGVSDDALTIVYQSTTNGMNAKYGTGESYDVKFDGKFYPMEGDIAQSMVSLKQLGPSKIEQSVQRDGKVVRVLMLTVAADGKSINVKATDLRDNTTMTYMLVKR